MSGIKLKSMVISFWGLIFCTVSAIFPMGAFAITGFVVNKSM